MKLMIYIVLLLNFYIYGQDIRFFQEDITFNLDREYFNVDGFYWFINVSNKNVEKLIFYPFDNNSNFGQIDSVEAFNITNSTELEISNLSKHGFLFLLKAAANDTEVCQIKYRQKIISDSIKYILTSTREWDHPLERAEYKLIVNKRIEITGLSYKPDKVYNIDGDKIYYWRKQNFLPKYDMIFRFKQ